MSSFKNLINKPNKIIINTFDKVFIIDADTIIHCEAVNNYTRFYLDNGEDILAAKTLSKFEELLSKTECFIRVHRSHLININHIKSFSKGEKCIISMTNNQMIPYSVDKRKILNSLLNIDIAQEEK